MKIKKSLLIIFVFLLAFSLATVFQISKTKAGVGNNGSGWLWGGSDDGAGNKTGVGWTSLNNTNTGGAVDYGVNIPVGGGDFPGPGYYAWNENIGWISFKASDLAGCPSGTCTARRVGNNLKGWARVLGIKDAAAAGNSGGWQGWIKLGSEAGDPIAYGTALNADGTITKGQNTSYAWSDELGWIDFSRASGSAAPVKTLTTSLTAFPPGCIGCSSLTSTLTGQRTGGTATGNITYQFDCTNDGTYEYTVTTAATSQAYSCTYSVTKTARVRMTQEGISSESTTIINILPAVCGDGTIGGSETCDDGANNGVCPKTCSAISCTTNSCASGVSGNWKEVAP